MTGKRGILQFLAIASLIFCVLFVIFSAPFWWRQAWILHSWPEIQAQVIRGDVTVEPGPDHAQIYSSKIQVLYTIAGRPMTAELTSFQSNNYQETATRAAEYGVGSRHLLRYDPAEPSQVRVGAGWNRRFFAVPLLLTAMAAFFALIAGGLWLWSRSTT